MDGSLACTRGCVCFDPRDFWIIIREREGTAVLGPGLEQGGMERQEVEEGASMEECRRSDDAAPPTKRLGLVYTLDVTWRSQYEATLYKIWSGRIITELRLFSVAKVPGL